MLKINYTLNKIILPWQQIHALGLIAVILKKVNMVHHC